MSNKHISCYGIWLHDTDIFISTPHWHRIVVSCVSCLTEHMGPLDSSNHLKHFILTVYILQCHITVCKYSFCIRYIYILQLTSGVIFVLLLFVLYDHFEWFCNCLIGVHKCTPISHMCVLPVYISGYNQGLLLVCTCKCQTLHLHQQTRDCMNVCIRAIPSTKASIRL